MRIMTCLALVTIIQENACVFQFMYHSLKECVITFLRNFPWVRTRFFVQHLITEDRPQKTMGSIRPM